MRNPLRALTFALEKYPERIELLPLEELVLESARQNDKRPAYVKLAVPDEIVKALKGARTGGRTTAAAPGSAGAGHERDLLLLVRLPAEVLERSESRIVLPGEVR